MTDALETFRRRFSGWVQAYHRATTHCANEIVLLELLGTRIGEQTQRLIGSAFLNGWLETEKAVGRGYFVRETDRLGSGGGQSMLSHMGNAKVAPCWEYYIQLADYARLRTVAEPRGLKVRLEDRLMDIAVWAGETLVLYVENKVTQQQAKSLLEKMRKYGETGFELNDVDNGNDPLRKAKYLIRDNLRPCWFGVSATNFQQLFSVEYAEHSNRFRLTERSDPLIAPLLSINSVVGEPPPQTAVDSFAVELDRYLGNRIWISPGTGQTAFNAYLPGEHSDSIVLGVYKTGEVWTNVNGIAGLVSEPLIQCLSSVGITVNASKSWSYWMTNGIRFNLREADVAEIARSVAQAIDASKD